MGVSFFAQANAQVVSQALLNMNNVEALVNDGGVFFNNHGTSEPGYEAPQGSGLDVLYAMGFWYGGIDVNGQLKLSVQKYENLADQFKGPLTNDGIATPPSSGTWDNALFAVNKAEIDNHIANYATPGYVVPFNIANWPAHGDVLATQDFYLAPFVDVDGDGMYDPTAGDYPCIRGDRAIYVIMNDKGGVHASGGEPIGIEMHYMFYEYVGIPEIENTTFVHLKLINRGTQTLYDFKVSSFLDGDVGYYDDDYFGTDSTRNMMYFYNGDNLDEAGGSSMGYQSSPPAVGIVSLSNDFASMGIANADATVVEYWNNMNGKNVSGAPWTNAAGSSSNYMFPGNPGNTSEVDSEVAQANTPGDRSGIANINLGTLVPFSEHSFDYAVVFHREEGVSNIDNAVGLKSVADAVQDFFDTTFVDDCVENVVALEEIKEVNFSIHPNPSSGHFTVVLADDFAHATMAISDVSGRIVVDHRELNGTETLIQLDQPAGVYLVHLMIEGRTSVKRIVVN